MRLHLLEHDPWEGQTNIDLWAQKRGHRITRTFVFEGQAPPGPDQFDCLVVTGGSQHAWEEDKHPWLAPEKEYLARVLAGDRIVLGLCFGGQLLAEALGATVFRNEHDEIGWYPVTLLPQGRNSFLFQGLPDEFLTFHWHSDHFTLPPGAIRLAFSQASPNQAFLAPGRVVGLQFHPEYTLDLIRTFIEEYGHEWTPGAYVRPLEEIRAQTNRLPETYWLMEALLDNLVREFG